ncbi:MAG: exopolysaccharide biosynthesis protein [Pseudomonadota bacterium]
MLNLGRAASHHVDGNVALVAVIDKVVEAADEVETISVDEVVTRVGSAGITPLLLLPAIAVATPLSGIPFFSTLMGVLIFLVSLQLLLRRSEVWLPHWLSRKEVSAARLSAAFRRIRGIAAWMDRHTHNRLDLLFRRPLIFVPQGVCLLSGAIMPILEFIPFSSSILGVGVTVLAIGLLARDGLILLLGLLPYAGVAALVFGAAT